MNVATVLLSALTAVGVAAAPVACGSGSSARATADAAAPGDGSLPEAAVDAAAPDGSDGATDGACPAASEFFSRSAVRAQCEAEHCCGPITSCLASAACVSYFRCTAMCFLVTDAGSSALSVCGASCLPDAAGAPGTAEFQTALGCTESQCGSLFLPDAGASATADGG